MDKRKEEIIEVALRRFRHYGFGKTTMNEVADDLGVTKANLYYYYPDKAALIKDVISHVSSELFAREKSLIDSYDGDFLGTLFAFLELRAMHMRENYILYINENLDWIKGIMIGEVLNDMKIRDNLVLEKFFETAVEKGEVKIKDVKDFCEGYIEAVRGISLSYTAHDVISGIPNRDNVDKILEGQKRITKMFFEERIVTI